LPASANLKKKLWERILHPVGNKRRTQLGWQKYVDGVSQLPLKKYIQHSLFLILKKTRCIKYPTFILS